MRLSFTTLSALTIIITFFIYYFNELNLDLIFFSLAFAIIFFNGLFARVDSEGIDIFRPYILTSVLLYLYSAAPIVFVDQTGLSIYKEFVSLQSLNIFLIACLLTQFGISLGFTFISRNKSINHYSSTKFDLNEINFFLACSLIFGILLLPFYYESFLPSAAESYTEWSLDSRCSKWSQIHQA